MRPVPIVPMQPNGQVLGAASGCRIGDGVSPFPERGLNEALGLAVGFGRVWFCADVLEAEIAAGLGESFRSVAGAVVGHDPRDDDAEAFVVSDSRLEKGDGALLALVG